MSYPRLEWPKTAPIPQACDSHFYQDRLGKGFKGCGRSIRMFISGVPLDCGVFLPGQGVAFKAVPIDRLLVCMMTDSPHLYPW